MSYLVDALKKAERERHENQRADMRSVAGGGPAEGSAGRALRWLVGVLVLCNAALLVYLFLPASVSAGLVASPATEQQSQPAVQGDTADESVTSPATAERPQRTAVRSDDSSATKDATPASEPEPEAAAPVVGAAGSAVQSSATDTAASPTLPPSRRNSDNDTPVESLPDAPVDARPRAGGKVTYSATPLDDDAGFVADEERGAPVADSPPPGAPDVAINGHLYSSVPGRSFILVRGQRYHEGERLAQGPAVESIDATGATLNYQGRRYHVRGPG
ncbi:hypothetical protein T5B8_01840 [Salinisphaera sp. T5B8]|uniref:general secretion pathway protein GspB n=1 Tax=Salinisphaera sp. T5B8 TaxID=1304154 RepID=UPI00333F2036